MKQFTFQEKNMLGTLHPIDSKNIETSNVSWTKENSKTANCHAELLGYAV